MERKQWKDTMAERTRQVQGRLDKPELDPCRPLDMLNSVRDISYLVRIDHEHIPVGPPSMLLGLGGFLPLGRLE